MSGATNSSSGPSLLGSLQCSRLSTFLLLILLSLNMRRLAGNGALCLWRQDYSSWELKVGSLQREFIIEGWERRLETHRKIWKKVCFRHILLRQGVLQAIRNLKRFPLRVEMQFV